MSLHDGHTDSKHEVEKRLAQIEELKEKIKDAGKDAETYRQEMAAAQEEKAAGTYTIYLQVTDKLSGLKFEKAFKLYASSRFVRGFYLYGDKYLLLPTGRPHTSQEIYHHLIN